MPLAHSIRCKASRSICVAFAAALIGLSSAQAQQESEPVEARVGKLESQISDLQVMIGTLESLLRQKPGATLQHETPSADSGLAPRVEALETQIGTLVSELQRIGKQLTAIEAKLDAAPPPPQGDESRAGIGWDGPSPDESAPREEVAAGSEDDAAALYRKAYGELLSENYKAAEAAFRQFLALHPRDAFAGNAQFWLGEAQYARGNYRGAVDTYRESYKTYGKSERAPDALLKLAMSLAALGESREACSTFGELEAKYPDAPHALRDQAKAERAKAGC